MKSITILRVTLDENGDGNYEHATHYSYDIHGNVKSLVQDNPTPLFRVFQR